MVWLEFLFKQNTTLLKRLIDLRDFSIVPLLIRINQPERGLPNNDSELP